VGGAGDEAVNVIDEELVRVGTVDDDTVVTVEVGRVVVPVELGCVAVAVEVVWVEVGLVVVPVAVAVVGVVVVSVGVVAVVAVVVVSVGVVVVAAVAEAGISPTPVVTAASSSSRRRNLDGTPQMERIATTYPPIETGHNGETFRCRGLTHGSHLRSCALPRRMGAG
jgi:hypothetical protein